MKKLVIIAILLLVASFASACRGGSPEGGAPETTPSAAGPSSPYPAPATPYPGATPGTVQGVAAEGLYPWYPDGMDVNWSHAVAMIQNGEVARVVQTHDLKVTLSLKDGRTLTAVEPAIDEVLKVIEACGAPCADIEIATE